MTSKLEELKAAYVADAAAAHAAACAADDYADAACAAYDDYAAAYAGANAAYAAAEAAYADARDAYAYAAARRADSVRAVKLDEMSPEDASEILVALDDDGHCGECYSNDAADAELKLLQGDK